MFSRGWQRPGARAQGSSHRALRGVTAILAAGLIVGACGGAAVSPSPSARGSGSPSPSGFPFSGPTYAAYPTPSYWWPEETPTLEGTPQATPEATPVRSPGSPTTPANFPLVRGTAPLAAPAGDHGAAAAAKINDFGFDLLRHMDASGNLCASPASIAIALAMLRPGARGTTATEMDTVLHSFGAPGQEAEIVALLQQLNGQTIYINEYGDPLEPGSTPDPANPDPVSELRVTNQAFAQPGMTLEQAYLNSLSSSFGAGVGLLDFKKDPEAARQVINQWASYNTKGRIPNVLQPGDLDVYTRLALANAIYLKGGWASPFDPEATKPASFTTASGRSVSVPTMATDSWFQYAAGSGYRAIELPLEAPSSMAVTIIVPDNMASFTSSLNAAKLSSIGKAMSTYDVDLTIPRFSVNSRFSLGDALSAMGMVDVFDPYKADLTGISGTQPPDQPLYVQKVIHQANIDVVEDGVTAAAVTVVIVGAGSAGPGAEPPHVKFQINKPFLYLVRETQSGTVLFMGRVDDPSPAG
jgi:serpin B